MDTLCVNCDLQYLLVQSIDTPLEWVELKSSNRALGFFPKQKPLLPTNGDRLTFR